MVLEATMLVLDNSEWMRNGDFVPSRLDAQTDAVNLLFNAKTQSNPENTVGLMTMAGKSPEVLVTLTSEIGQILAATHKMKMSGKIKLSTGIQIASLALKHRQNKNQRQRIIVFVGSPIEEDEKSFIKLAKKLKKNNVAVDFVNFGEEVENTPKLEAFIEAINNNDNSHLLSVPPGQNILSDILLTSSIVAGEDGAPAGFGGGAGGDFEFGVDPNLDPELALALRISMEEERARQEATQKENGAGDTEMAVEENQGKSEMDVEDEQIAQAIRMSMENDGSNEEKKEKK